MSDPSHLRPDCDGAGRDQPAVPLLSRKHEPQQSQPEYRTTGTSMSPQQTIAARTSKTTTFQHPVSSEAGDHGRRHILAVMLGMPVRARMVGWVKPGRWPSAVTRDNCGADSDQALGLESDKCFDLHEHAAGAREDGECTYTSSFRKELMSHLRRPHHCSAPWHHGRTSTQA